MKVGFNYVKVVKTRIDSKFSIHFCIYESRADASLENTAENIINKPNSNNYILGKTVIYDISPKISIVLSSTVKRKKKITSSCYFRAQDTVSNRISRLQFGSLFQT